MTGGLLLTGETLGRYRIERLLGTGGMGQVYLATHSVLEKPVAIKIINADLTQNDEAVTRFFNEARAAASLRHPNIIDVTDFDRAADGRLFMVLEYLEGETLSSRLEREKALEPVAALGILAPVCAAVDAAHGKGIVHRDLKPANIFLARQPGLARLVKVLDFGVAKLQSEERRDGEITRAGSVVGTPRYMSPEQALGRRDELGPASDVYSLGVIAFGMLAGRFPFEGTTGELITAHASEPPPPLASAAPHLPGSLGRVIERALAKKPAARWRRTVDFARALELALDASRERELAEMLDDSTRPGVAASAGEGKGQGALIPDEETPLIDVPPKGAGVERAARSVTTLSRATGSTQPRMQRARSAGIVVGVALAVAGGVVAMGARHGRSSPGPSAAGVSPSTRPAPAMVPARVAPVKTTASVAPAALRTVRPATPPRQATVAVKSAGPAPSGRDASRTATVRHAASRAGSTAAGRYNPDGLEPP